MTKSVEVERQDQTLTRLLSSDIPSVRYLTLRDLLGRPENAPDVVAARKRIASWIPIEELLAEQQPDGYWGEPEDVYWPKWRATVWPLILLAEMGVPGELPAVKRGCEYLLRAMDAQDPSWPPNYSENDARGQWAAYRSVWEPCVIGNIARTLTVFGFSEDGRVRDMLEWLIKYQLPD